MLSSKQVSLQTETAADSGESVCVPGECTRFGGSAIVCGR